jgi:hypothetical protein
MFELNDLIEQARQRALFDAEASLKGLESLHAVLRDQLALKYKLQFERPPQEGESPGGAFAA